MLLCSRTRNTTYLHRYEASKQCIYTYIHCFNMCLFTCTQLCFFPSQQCSSRQSGLEGFPVYWSFITAVVEGCADSGTEEDVGMEPKAGGFYPSAL